MVSERIQRRLERLLDLLVHQVLEPKDDLPKVRLEHELVELQLVGGLLEDERADTRGAETDDDQLVATLLEHAVERARPPTGRRIHMLVDGEVRS